MAPLKPIDLLVTYRLAFDWGSPSPDGETPLKRHPARFAGVVRQRGLAERHFFMRYRCDTLPLPGHPWEEHDHGTVSEAMACAAAVADVMRQRYSDVFSPHFVRVHTHSTQNPMGSGGEEPTEDEEAAAVGPPATSHPPLHGRPITDVHEFRR